MMICPKCQALMDRVLAGSLVIDRCSGCKGLWFDAGELEQLSQLRDSEMLDLGLPALGHAFDAQPTPQMLLCPRCDRGLLQHIHDAGHEAIRIDRCPHCLGSFLDAGEFTAYKRHGWLSQVRNWYARQLR